MRRNRGNDVSKSRRLKHGQSRTRSSDSWNKPTQIGQSIRVVSDDERYSATATGPRFASDSREQNEFILLW